MGMHRVLEARRRNLLALIERENDEHGRGGVLSVARKLGYKWPGFVGHMKSQPGATGHRAMTEATARQLEIAFLLPTGSMDTYPLPAPGAKAERSADTNRLVMLLADAADRAGAHLPPEKLEAAVRAMEQAGRADSAYADIVVSLMK